MAILFCQHTEGRRLEVRSAGRTRRLYVDGVLHTQHNPAVPLTGDVWDPIALSALLRPVEATRRVLILGLGGGAVVHLLRRFVGPLQMDAIELDGLRIELAQRFFGLRHGAPASEQLEVHRAEATRWVEGYGGLPYDLIVDDLFAEERGQPVRAVDLDGRWLSALLRLLAPDGQLTVNLPDATIFAEAYRQVGKALKARFPRAFRFDSDRAENAVVSFGPEASSGEALHRRMLAHPEMAGARARALARFRVVSLW